MRDGEEGVEDGEVGEEGWGGGWGEVMNTHQFK